MCKLISTNETIFTKKLEVKLNGSMKDKANDEARARLVEWARKGPPLEHWK